MAMSGPGDRHERGGQRRWPTRRGRRKRRTRRVDVVARPPVPLCGVHGEVVDEPRPIRSEHQASRASAVAAWSSPCSSTRATRRSTCINDVATPRPATGLVVQTPSPTTTRPGSGRRPVAVELSAGGLSQPARRGAPGSAAPRTAGRSTPRAAGSPGRGLEGRLVAQADKPADRSGPGEEHHGRPRHRGKTSPCTRCAHRDGAERRGHRPRLGARPQAVLARDVGQSAVRRSPPPPAARRPGAPSGPWPRRRGRRRGPRRRPGPRPRDRARPAPACARPRTVVTPGRRSATRRVKRSTTMRRHRSPVDAAASPGGPAVMVSAPRASRASTASGISARTARRRPAGGTRAGGRTA